MEKVRDYFRLVIPFKTLDKNQKEHVIDCCHFVKSKLN